MPLIDLENRLLKNYMLWISGKRLDILQSDDFKKFCNLIFSKFTVTIIFQSKTFCQTKLELYKSVIVLNYLYFCRAFERQSYCQCVSWSCFICFDLNRPSFFFFPCVDLEHFLSGQFYFTFRMEFSSIIMKMNL